MSCREKIVAEIVSNFTRMRKLPKQNISTDNEYQNASLHGPGNGKFIPISEAMDNLIKEFSYLKRDEFSLHTRFTDNDIFQTVQRVFASVLFPLWESDVEIDSSEVAKDIEEKVASQLIWISSKGSLEYAFGCTLFTYDDIAPFEIGPVCFEPRLTWLQRKASDGRRARVGLDGRIERFDHNIAEGPVSKVTKRRLIRIWSGENLKRRKHSADSRCEQDFVRAIGNCPYVCSVKIPGFGGKAGQDKALISARLALATISLLWQIPSKALEGLNLLFDRETRVRNTLSFTSDGLVLGGSTMRCMPNSPWIERDELEQYLASYRNIFKVAGDAISYLLSPTDSNRPKIMNTLAHALLWFHEGCRESVNSIALVKLAAALDALSGGRGKTYHIRKLVNARLEVSDMQEILPDGSTLKQIVERIFGEGRSRMIHGTSEKLQYDWSETRSLAERLARDCIVACLGWAVENSALDDPKQLLV